MKKRQGKSIPILSSHCSKTSNVQIVFIHGIADSPDVWIDVAKRLPRKFVTYHQLELPWSDAVGDPIDYSIDPEDILHDVWRELPKGSKIVIAHSFGGNAFLRMIEKFDINDVSSCVLLSAYLKTSYQDFTWPMFTRYVNEFDKFIDSSINARLGVEKLSSESKLLIREKTKDLYSPQSWMKFYMVFSSTPGMNTENIDIPILFLTGENDSSILADDTEKFSHKFLNSEFKIIPGCGHFSLIEDPDYIAKDIYSFLISRKII